jgi:hypothetical protein
MPDYRVAHKPCTLAPNGPNVTLSRTVRELGVTQNGVTPSPGAQTGSRRSPPWAATAQMTKTSRVMMSSDQNG